jgi:hypothetical protein
MMSAANWRTALASSAGSPVALRRAFSSVAVKRRRASLWIASSAARSIARSSTRSP